jgi:hypothetical protein
MVCLIGAVSPHVTRADLITIGTTPFAGIETNFQTIGNQSLPYTDAFNRVVNGGQSIQSGSGVFTFAGQTLTFTNLAPGTHEIGFGLSNQSTDFFIKSVTLSNGDSVNVGSSFLDSFLSFSDPTAFTSASVVFAGNCFGSGYVTDFRTTLDVLSAVPEPASLFLLATVVALLIGGVWLCSRSTPSF